VDPDKELDCRGTYQAGGSFTVSTLVPGSYGLLNGLGPSGFDIPPYGPKLVHFRVTAPGYKTLVTEVQLGGGIDLRGPSMVIDGVRASVEDLLEGEGGKMTGKGECCFAKGQRVGFMMYCHHCCY
jgi:protocatechuate 3,4-dioxygenase beta subunit